VIFEKRTYKDTIMKILIGVEAILVKGVLGGIDING
jgi:hypothetical protein